jgi:hypothetical protein
VKIASANIPGRKKPVRTGAIVGGVVGALSFLALTILVVLLVRRARRRLDYGQEKGSSIFNPLLLPPRRGITPFQTSPQPFQPLRRPEPDPYATNAPPQRYPELQPVPQKGAFKLRRYLQETPSRHRNNSDPIVDSFSASTSEGSSSDLRRDVEHLRRALEELREERGPDMDSPPPGYAQ